MYNTNLHCLVWSVLWRIMHCQSTTFTAELCFNVDFSLGELDRIHSPSLVKYPLLNTYIIYILTKETFVWLAVWFCGVQSPHRAQVSKQRWLPKLKSSFDRSFKMACKGLQSVMSFSQPIALTGALTRFLICVYCWVRCKKNSSKAKYIGWDVKFLIYKMLQ